MIKGTYQETPDPPFVLGLEVSGRVSSLGQGVAGLKVGQRVAAYTGRGGFAEAVTVDATRCVAIPEGISDVEAAGFLITYGTSHLALKRRARLKMGERLAVLGAAGGAGLTAVEIGHAMGADVLAVARGVDRLEIARARGANRGLDLAAADDLPSALKAEGPFDVVYDAVGGAAGEAALRALRPEGRHLLIGFASGDLPRLRPNHMMVKNQEVIGVNWGGYMRFAPEVMAETIAELFDWVAEGRLSPEARHVYPLERIDEAMALLKSREATGKIVVTP